MLKAIFIIFLFFAAISHAEQRSVSELNCKDLISPTKDTLADVFATKDLKTPVSIIACR